VARAVLHFNKAKDQDMYFFNSYKVELQSEQLKGTFEQTFFINKGNNITLKEAYNLMQGRAVNKDLTSKEGEVYNTWLQINFKMTDASGNFKLNYYHQNYGYDLKSILGQYPIKELENDNSMDELMYGLKKGNLQEVTFLKEGQEIKQFIQANPQFKTIGIYNSEMKRLPNKECKDEKQLEVQSELVSETKKKSQSHQSDATEMAQGTRKKRQGRSNSL
jgi:hypothetical protein